MDPVAKEIPTARLSDLTQPVDDAKLLIRKVNRGIKQRDQSGMALLLRGKQASDPNLQMGRQLESPARGDHNHVRSRRLDRGHFSQSRGAEQGEVPSASLDSRHTPTAFHEFVLKILGARQRSPVLVSDEHFEGCLGENGPAGLGDFIFIDCRHMYMCLSPKPFVCHNRGLVGSPLLPPF
jgi:hypothetical protein